ncbi:hypothetical protein CJ030_MR5G003463 [Morella rubra]|uniref:Uncharacterized protein n=1 Tax=Morella rubra TaxID=262757 RepID=A0A6A1VNF0_9ROSI|nr:hypothetical protein CJ030_MR5G003463 [Morella rubra]
MAEEGAEKGIERMALEALGKGFDLASDFRLKFAKGSKRLVVVDELNKRDIVIPGGRTIRGVPQDIRCDKGDRLRFKSDVLQFNQLLDPYSSSMAEEGAEKGIERMALEALGKGFDLASDFRLKFAKGSKRLVVVDELNKRDIVIPGGRTIRGVPQDIRCDKGDRLRFKKFNQALLFPRRYECWLSRKSMRNSNSMGIKGKLTRTGLSIKKYITGRDTPTPSGGTTGFH